MVEDGRRRCKEAQIVEGSVEARCRTERSAMTVIMKPAMWWPEQGCGAAPVAPEPGLLVFLQRRFAPRVYARHRPGARSYCGKRRSTKPPVAVSEGGLAAGSV
jgi:hypothetical protein